MWAKAMVMARRARVERKLAPLLAVAIGACGAHGADLGMPGASDRAPEAPRHPETAASSSAETWPLAAEVPTYPAVDERELPSGHNAPYWSGVVRVSPSVESLYRALAPSSAVPVGAVLVEQHHGQDGSTGPQYAMVKRESGFDAAGGDWEYFVVEPSGKVASRGALSYCSRCHGDASADHLFGPRTATRRRLAGIGPGDGGTALSPEEDEARAPEGEIPGTTGSKPAKSRKKKAH